MSFPETLEELEAFSQGFSEALKELTNSPWDFQQEFSIPQIPEDVMFYRDEMKAAGGHLAFNEHQITDFQDQMTQYNELTSFTGDSSCSDEMKILACQHPFHGYQTSGYRGKENLFVDPQMTRPFGGQPRNDWPQMQAPGFDAIPHGNATNFGEEWNMCQDSGTTGNCKDTASLGQRTIAEAVSILPDHKSFPDVEGSRGPQMTSFGNQTPYVDPSICPSSSFVVESQPPKSSSVSPAVLGELPQEKSEQQIQSQVSKNRLPPLRLYSCLYQDCGKSYRKAFHLKHHMKKHTGEKPYECDEPGCSWKFYRSEDLKRHKTKHGGERPHPCAKCNRRFSRLSYLKQHQKVCIQA